LSTPDGASKQMSNPDGASKQTGQQ
jgi:hypothetical protein